LPADSTVREITRMITDTRATFTNRNTDGKLQSTTEMMPATSDMNTMDMMRFRESSTAGMPMGNCER